MYRYDFSMFRDRWLGPPGAAWLRFACECGSDSGMELQTA